MLGIYPCILTNIPNGLPTCNVFIKKKKITTQYHYGFFGFFFSVNNCFTILLVKFFSLSKTLF